MLIVMSVGPGESTPGESAPGERAPAEHPEAPPLPPMLLQVWPVIVIGVLGWLAAAAAGFLVPALQSWRPVTLAGLGVGLLGTSIFVLQLTAARRGARGAQTGLENYLNRK